MTKLENTQKNKTLVLVGSSLAFATLGFALARKNERTAFAIGGLVIGLMAYSGISSWLIKPKKQIV